MPARMFSDEEDREVAKSYLAGISQIKISEAYHCTQKVIQGALKRQNINKRNVSERNRIYELDPYVFDCIDNEEAAYWWGFLWADGAVLNHRTIALSLKTEDKLHIYKFRSFLKSTHPIRDEVLKPFEDWQKQRELSRFYPADIHLASRLQELGIIKSRPSINPILNYLPRKLENHFIRGVFDGDGSIYKTKRNYPRITICGQKELLEWVWGKISENYPEFGKMNVYPHSIIFRLEKVGVLPIQGFLKYIYHNATIYLERKREISKSC